MQQLIEEAQNLKAAIETAKKIGPMSPGKKIQAAEKAVDASYRLLIKVLGKIDDLDRRLLGVEHG